MLLVVRFNDLKRIQLIAEFDNVIVNTTSTQKMANIRAKHVNFLVVLKSVSFDNIIQLDTQHSEIYLILREMKMLI